MPTPWEQGFVEIADRCFVGRYREWDVSVGVVVGTSGAVVVDTRAGLRQGRRLRDDVRRLPQKPDVRWVVNTHEHFDHVLGNGAFPGAAIHAHEVAAAAIPTATAEIKRAIAADRGPDPAHPELTDDILDDVLTTEPVLPTKTFSSAATIDLGDRYVELLHLGRGHTGGDAVLRVPDCDLVFAGDLVEESPARDATPGFGSDCWPLEWTSTLDLLIGLLTPRSLVVPGHGTVVDRDFVERQRDDIADLAAMVRDLAAAGVPVDEALAAGERYERAAPLSAMVEPDLADAATGTRSGWPFPVRYLDQAVRRAYAQLAPAPPATSLPLTSVDTSADRG